LKRLYIFGLLFLVKMVLFKRKLLAKFPINVKTVFNNKERTDVAVQISTTLLNQLKPHSGGTIV